MSSRECEEYPCIHVVVDNKSRLYAIFIEDWDGNVIPVKSSEIEKAYKELAKLRREGYREASEASELDRLAREGLGAEPVEEE